MTNKVQNKNQKQSNQNIQDKVSYNFADIMNKNLDKTFEICGEDFDVEPDGCTLGFSYFNPNPRGSITGDCVKRAIVVATGKDYHELELFMNRNKVRKDLAYNFKENFEHSIELLGGVKLSMTVPAGTRRWHVNSINKVMSDYPHINYCMRVNKHLIGVRGQTIFDLFDDRVRDKGIHNLFIFGATPEEAAEIQARCAQGDGKVNTSRRFYL